MIPIPPAIRQEAGLFRAPPSGMGIHLLPVGSRRSGGSEFELLDLFFPADETNVGGRPRRGFQSLMMQLSGEAAA
jgi:hypothetical protein